MMKFINTVYAHTGEVGGPGNVAWHHGFGMMDNLGWFGIGAGWFFMILFWVLIVLAVLALAKFISGGRKSGEKQVYVCAECGFKYEDKEWVMKCQKWCAEHKSCNLEITKHSQQK